MKPFKTLDEQIEILRSRGLIITEEEKAKEYLLQYSYYNVINVYSKFFQEKENKYLPNATFSEIRAVHIFDTELKSIFFKYLIECEKHFKSIVAYRFSEQYKNQPYAYLKTSSYKGNDLLGLSSTISLLSKTIIDKNKSHKPNSIKHYRSNHRDIPLWVLINYLTFGQVVYMYQHFTDKLKNAIAKDMAKYVESNTERKITLEAKDIESILFNLIDIRNCVAHNNKLFNYKCKKNVRHISTLYTPARIEKNDSTQTPYCCFISMQILLDKGQYATFHNAIRKRTRNLNQKLGSIQLNCVLSALGFPESWLEFTSNRHQN